MANEGNKKAWDRFEADIQGLAGELKRHYRSASDERNTAALNRSLDQLRQAADAVMRSLETATRDPEVRTKARETASACAVAIGDTFRDRSDEIEQTVR